MEIDPESVTSREDFARFVAAFRADLLTNPKEWENQTLEDFLDALSRYVEDVPGYLKNVRSAVHPEIPSWQLFAITLCGARVYE
jgi:hypothetical protein